MDEQLRARLDDPALLDDSLLEHVQELDDLGSLHPDLAGIRTEYVDVAGARARLLRVDGAAEGPTLVLVHGLGGCATNWLPVMRPLSTIGDVVAVDLQGFGETAPPRPGAARPRNNGRFVATLVHSLDVGPVVLVGNSMGGLVSTFAAGEHPDLVAHLVLLCPALPAHLPSARVSRVQLTAFGPMMLPVLGKRIIRRRLAGTSYEQRYDDLIGEILVDPSAVTHVHRQIGIANLARVRDLRWRGHAYREATSGTLQVHVGSGRAAAVAAMRSVQAPTLFVRGRRDPLVLAAATEQVRRTRPDWVVDEPSHVGHVPMLEDPEWTADRIATFVTGAPLRVTG